ncbi:polysaccharide lyase family 1 protein [Saccharata proteae CBS 121410]|uniref:pectate lyase n=1 Tax=Saccharata proteae CBS 121410 TaxID=1314787 RepID=A0A9P4HPN9_9PEZI|nr:polysaccharide lyase family 1 protein [Saccharata proteae CBS 121410]
MKASILAIALSTIAQLAVAAPSRTIEHKAKANLVKRASITDGPDVGYATQNGGTTGGAGGTTTTVSSFAEFSAAVSSDDAMVVIVDGPITDAAKVEVGSNKSIIGKNYNAILTGIGLYVKGATNVIIRNLTIKEVLAENGDAIGVSASSNVWVDHCDLSSNLDHDKDYYDGLMDVTHASDYVTISNTYLHDHWKASLVGHSDSNGSEDEGHLLVTFANNLWSNIKSRGPSYRFGSGHVINSYYENVSDGINTRDGAQLLVESNVFSGSDKPLYSTNGGYAVSNDNDFDGGESSAEAGSLSSVPYQYTLLGSGAVKDAVVGTAGATLSF